MQTFKEEVAISGWREVEIAEGHVDEVSINTFNYFYQEVKLISACNYDWSIDLID